MMETTWAMKNLLPGEMRIIQPGEWFSIEPLSNASRNITLSAGERCLCVARLASVTVHGLTIIKVVVLTSRGLGMRRFNFGDVSVKDALTPRGCKHDLAR